MFHQTCCFGVIVVLHNMYAHAYFHTYYNFYGGANLAFKVNDHMSAIHLLYCILLHYYCCKYLQVVDKNYFIHKYE